MRYLRPLLALCLMLAIAGIARADEPQMEDMNTVVLRTIDKLSARTHTFDIPVDKTVKFGNSLFIKARACRKASPLEKPESAAFLQIWERKPAEDKSHWLFSGWMFASSPSLSRMDHPVYDVWVIECKNAATSKSEVFSSETAPKGAPEAPAGAKGGDAAAKKVSPENKSGAEPGSEATPAAAPATADEPATDDGDDEEPIRTDEAPAPKAEGKPAPKAPATDKQPVPPLDKLPGSFDEGDDSGGGNE